MAKTTTGLSHKSAQTQYVSDNVSLETRRRLAEEDFTVLEWKDEETAFIKCPVTDHRTAGKKNCWIKIDGPATADCRHGCDLDEVNTRFRNRIREAGKGLMPIPIAPAKPKPKPAKVEQSVIEPAPRDPTDAELNHFERGQPTKTWIYPNADGLGLWCACRWDFAGEDGTPEKDIRPLTWQDEKWQFKAHENNRPLYGLDLLDKRSSVPVLVVEGEKTADAARSLLPDLVVVTWPMGSKAVAKANWTPLDGRDVTIWADADEAGKAATESILKILPSAKVVDVSTLPDAWDLAEDFPEGWDLKRAKQAIADAKAPLTIEEPKQKVSEFFYRKDRKDYLQAFPNGQLVPVFPKDAKLALMHEGQAADADHAERLLYDVRQLNSIDYFGSMSGYPVGLHEEGGQKYYCTHGPSLVNPIPPKAGSGFGSSWPITLKLLTGLLGAGIQLNTFLAHLKVSMEGLRRSLRHLPAGKVRSVTPAQTVVLVGPKNCGKSFVLKYVFGALLGNRIVEAFKSFSGDSGFNGELLKGEVWTIDDRENSTDIRSRRKLASSIKSYIYTERVSFESKHHTPITITPFGRLVICCNDTPENLTVLPPITPDIEDKIHLFKCEFSSSVMPTRTEDEKEAYRNAIAAELPYLAGELEAWEIPADIREPRSGVKTYMHPEILSALRQQAPEATLAELIASAFDDGLFNGLCWCGTAAQIQKILTGSGNSQGRRAERLLSWDKAAGTYLSRIDAAVEAFVTEFGIRIQRMKQGSGSAKGIVQYRLIDERKEARKEGILPLSVVK